MAVTTTKIGIINRALQLLGIKAINSLSENSRGAHAMLRAYDSVLLAELESHVWNFSIKRMKLAEDATSPAFGKANQFPLPGDFLYLASEETTYQSPIRRDWTIEGNKIITDDDGPLEIRYVSSNLTESQFSATFAESLAASLALNTCEEITNSNTKLANLEATYNKSIQRAKRRNDIQNSPVKTPKQSWITVRG